MRKAKENKTVNQFDKKFEKFINRLRHENWSPDEKEDSDMITSLKALKSQPNVKKYENL